MTLKQWSCNGGGNGYTKHTNTTTEAALLCYSLVRPSTRGGGAGYVGHGLYGREGGGGGAAKKEESQLKKIVRDSSKLT